MTSTPGRAHRLLSEAFQDAERSVVAQALARQPASGDSGSATEPSPGECWLLRWDDQSMLALVSRVHPHHVLVMPLSVEAALADDSAVIGPGHHAGFAGDIAVYAMLETGIGPWVLDRYVTTVTTVEEAAGLRTWMRTDDDGALPPSWHQGLPTPHAAHPRRMARAEVNAVISALGDADWLPEGWTRGEVETEPMGERLTAKAVHAVLKGTPQRANAIARGEVVATAEEQAALAAAGLVPTARAQVDRDVIAELDSVRHKGDLLVLAARRNVGEGQVRVQLAQDNFALAARHSPGNVHQVSDRVLLLRAAIEAAVAQEGQ